MAGGVTPRGGKKGRKVGKGKHKMSHSKWGAYAAIHANQHSRRLGRMARSFCKACRTQFHSKAAFNKHDCK